MEENEPEENGAYIIRIPKEMVRTENDNREYLEKHFSKEEYRIDEDLFLE